MERNLALPIRKQLHRLANSNSALNLPPATSRSLRKIESDPNRKLPWPLAQNPPSLANFRLPAKSNAQPASSTAPTSDPAEPENLSYTPQTNPHKSLTTPQALCLPLLPATLQPNNPKPNPKIRQSPAAPRAKSVSPKFFQCAKFKSGVEREKKPLPLSHNRDR